MKEFEIIVLKEDSTHYKRLDHFLTDKIKDISRNLLKNLFQKGFISLSPKGPLSHDLELKKMPPPGSIISIRIPPPAPADAQGENIPLKILYEDEDLLLIDKQAGLVVHPAPGHPTGTLVNAIIYHCKDLKGVGDQKRPGIVHRLDKGTSGVMTIAKTQKCHEKLVDLFSRHAIEREYRAIVMKTKIPPKGEIESPIGRHPQNRLKMASGVSNGKWSKTYYKVLSYFSPCSLLSCTLETGRTHQIRVHLSQNLKAPLLMDPLYGNPKDHLKRLPPPLSKLIKDYPHPFLHAAKLGFTHPITKKELLFEAPLPPLFQSLVDGLKNC